MEKLSNLKRKDLQFNGVYKITNIVNNKIYIGSCSSKTFLYERLKHHEQDLINNKHCNKYLQRAFNKYKIDNFYYEIIEVCNSENCIEKEQYWINLLKPHYNLCKKAGSSFGVICEQETKDKIRDANKLWWSKKENKEKMKIAFKKAIRKPKKIKVKKEFHGHCKKVLNLETNEIYNSVMEASKSLNMSYTFLIFVLNGKAKSTKKIQYV